MDIYVNSLLLLFLLVVPVKASSNGPGHVTVEESETAVLSCLVGGPTEFPMVVWRKVDVQLPLTVGTSVFSEDERISVQVDGQNWNLMIRHTVKSDGGDYICTATTKEYRIDKVFTLDVIEATEESTTAETTTLSANTTKQDDTDKGDAVHSSKEISEQVLRATQIEFYREQILTDRKRREMMDTEKEFYEAALRYLQQQEKENTQ